MSEAAALCMHDPEIKMLLYLLAHGPSHGDGEESDDASAYVVLFPLLAEQT